MRKIATNFLFGGLPGPAFIDVWRVHGKVVLETLE